jgi:hypothetical protein
MVGEGAVEVGLHQHRLDLVGVLHIDGRIGRGAEPGHVERAAQQPLDHAVVVGGREERHGHAQRLLGIAAQAFVRGQAVLGVLAAQKADAELGDGGVLGPALEARRWRKEDRKEWSS